MLNPITKPKPKKQHNFRFHENLIPQSFPSSTHTCFNQVGGEEIEIERMSRKKERT